MRNVLFFFAVLLATAKKVDVFDVMLTYSDQDAIKALDKVSFLTLGRTRSRIVIPEEFASRAKVGDLTLLDATYLDVACLTNKPGVVAELARRGAKLNGRVRVESKLSGWYTPLHLAALVGDADVIRTLLIAGANHEELTDGRLHSLAIAADRGHLAAFRELIANGVPLDYDPEHAHPIHLAALGGHTDIVLECLKNGIDVDKKSHSGRGDTALHAVSQAGKLEMVELLLEHGANPAVTSGDGATSIDLSTRFGHQDVTDLLRAMGAPDPQPVLEFVEMDEDGLPVGIPETSKDPYVTRVRREKRAERTDKARIALAKARQEARAKADESIEAQARKEEEEQAKREAEKRRREEESRMDDSIIPGMKAYKVNF